MQDIMLEEVLKKMEATEPKGRDRKAVGEAHKAIFYLFHV